MRYLSDEWVKAQWDAAEEAGYFDTSENGSDCGWGYDGPCGGCDRCCIAQFSYSLQKERERALVFLRAGMKVADPSLITVDYHAGFMGYHDAYNCKMAGETESFFYPWDRKDGHSGQH